MSMFARIIEPVSCKLTTHGLVIFGVIKSRDLATHPYWLAFYDMIRSRDLATHPYWSHILKAHYYNLYHTVA